MYTENITNEIEEIVPTEEIEETTEVLTEENNLSGLIGLAIVGGVAVAGAILLKKRKAITEYFENRQIKKLIKKGYIVSKAPVEATFEGKDECETELED